MPVLSVSSAAVSAGASLTCTEGVVITNCTFSTSVLRGSMKDSTKIASGYCFSVLGMVFIIL